MKALLHPRRQSADGLVWQFDGLIPRRYHRLEFTSRFSGGGGVHTGKDISRGNTPVESAQLLATGLGHAGWTLLEAKTPSGQVVYPAPSPQN